MIRPLMEIYSLAMNYVCFSLSLNRNTMQRNHYYSQIREGARVASRKVVYYVSVGVQDNTEVDSGGGGRLSHCYQGHFLSPLVTASMCLVLLRTDILRTFFSYF